MAHAVTSAEQDGIPVLELSSPELTARFAPAAGMAGCSLVHRGEELLEQRGGLAAYARAGKTFGIPLLAPWANRLPSDAFAVGEGRVDLGLCAERVRRDEHGLPIHGLLAGDGGWRVDVAEGSTAGARLRATLGVALDCFPFPHELTVEVALRGAALSVTTSVRPTGAAGVPLAFGWHPYLGLPGPPREAWEVRLPLRRHLELDRRGLPTGRASALAPVAGRLGSRTYDDLFADLVPGEPFVLAGGGRRIEVAFDAGYPFAQVFAPPGSSFVCFEPMAAPVAALATGNRLRFAPPGETRSATFTVTVGP